MQIVKYSEITKETPTPSTVIWEYPTLDKDISGAVAEIHGRYPEKGFAVNKNSKELVFVLSGNGKIHTPVSQKEVDLGDVIFIDKGEQFAWSGGMTIFMATSPKFDPKQHIIQL
jgi:mannose-6-phosphate isomerase-like protein (cupin superfamily)